MTGLSVQVRGMDDVNDMLRRLKITPSKRRWVHITLSRRVRSLARKRIINAENIDGSAWEPRKRKEFDSKQERKSKKMLRGLGHRARARGDANSGVVDWSGKFVAGYHQTGGEEEWDAAKAKKVYGTDKYAEPATRNQAKRLLSLGYKVRRGAGWKRPTLKQITSSMTMGQAGFLIKELKHMETADKWTIKVPERSFLGVNDDDQKQLLTLAMKTIMGIKA